MRSLALCPAYGDHVLEPAKPLLMAPLRCLVQECSAPVSYRRQDTSWVLACICRTSLSACTRTSAVPNLSPCWHWPVPCCRAAAAKHVRALLPFWLLGLRSKVAESQAVGWLQRTQNAAATSGWACPERAYEQAPQAGKGSADSPPRLSGPGLWVPVYSAYSKACQGSGHPLDAAAWGSDPGRQPGLAQHQAQVHHQVWPLTCSSAG